MKRMLRGVLAFAHGTAAGVRTPKGSIARPSPCTRVTVGSTRQEQSRSGAQRGPPSQYMTCVPHEKLAPAILPRVPRRQTRPSSTSARTRRERLRAEGDADHSRSANGLLLRSRMLSLHRMRLRAVDVASTAQHYSLAGRRERPETFPALHCDHGLHADSLCCLSHGLRPSSSAGRAPALRTHTR